MKINSEIQNLESIIGLESLREFANSILQYTGTCIAFYRENGEEIFFTSLSPYCQLLSKDKNSPCRKACAYLSNRVMKLRTQLNDENCPGGIKIFTMPILLNDTLLGSITTGISNPPKDYSLLQDIASLFSLEESTLKLLSNQSEHSSEIFKFAKDYVSSIAYTLASTYLSRICLLSLNNFSSSIASIQDAETLLPMIAEETRKILEMDATALLILDEKQEKFVLKADSYLPFSLKEKLHFPYKMLSDFLSYNEIPLLFPAHKKNELFPFFNELIIQEGFKSFLVLPISNSKVDKTSTHPIGFLILYSKSQIESLSEEKKIITSLLGNQVSLAIQRVSGFAERDKKIAHLQVINQISQAIGTSIRFEQLLELIYWQTGRVIDTTNFYLVLWDQELNSLSFEFETEDGKRKERRARLFENGLTEYILKTKHSLLISENLPSAVRELGIEPKGRISQCWLGAPLIVGDKAIGVIAVQSYECPKAYTEEDKTLIETIANQAAIAVQNAILFETASRQIKELSVLHQLSHDITSYLELDVLVTQALRVLKDTFGYLNCAILFLDKSKNELYIKAAQGYPEEVINKTRLKVGVDGITGWVAANGKSLIVPDVTSDPRYIDGVTGARSELAVPLKAGNEIIGVLDVESTEVNAFTKQDEEMLTSFASQLSIAIENARLYQGLENRIKELDLLTLITNKINMGISLDETLETILEEVRKIIPYQSARIYIHDEVRAVLIPRVVRFEEGVFQKEYEESVRTTALRIGQGIVGWVAQNKKFANVKDSSNDPRNFNLPGSPEKSSVLAVPLLVEENPIGVIALFKTGESEFSSPEIRLLLLLANEAAIAIHKARLYEEAKRLAISDGLTQLYNSRYFYEALKREFESAERYAETLSLIIFDIDDFKKANDTFGHQIGDHFLKQIANILPSLTRKTDIIARYGGDEFALLFPRTDREASLSTAERIRSKVASYPLSNSLSVDEKGGTTKLTISLGVATYPYDATNYRDFVRAADIALYAAKRAGKNCVYSYDNLKLKELPRSENIGELIYQYPVDNSSY